MKTPFVLPRLVIATAVSLLVAPLSANAQQKNNADRPIVYAARYYGPPAANSQSRYHLYRINPDGSARLQLTSGALDDIQPFWSHDGKTIAFERMDISSDKGGSTATRLCVMPARGGKIITLAIVKDGTFDYAFSPTAPDLLAFVTPTEPSTSAYTAAVCIVNAATGRVVRTLPNAAGVQWSPDGKRLLLFATSDDKGAAPSRILEFATGKETPIADKIGDAVCWAGSDLLVVKPAGDGTGAELLVINASDGQTARRITVTPDKKAREIYTNEAQDLTSFFSLNSFPNTGKAVLYSHITGDSTSGKWLMRYRVDIETGRMTYWGETGDLDFSPDAARFLTILGRDLAPYGKKNGRERTVWVRPLQIGQTASPDKKKPLVSGLVLIGGVSWRGGK